MSSLDSLVPPGAASPALEDQTPIIDRARAIASTLLEPNAEAVDRMPIVPREQIDALAAAGLLGLSGPVGFGGQAATSAIAEQVAEIVSGACGVTHFTQAQHHGPVSMLATTDNEAVRDANLSDLCTGRKLAGVAFSHLRRPGPPAVAAIPVPGGHEVSGEAPWVTSWGLADLFVIAALRPDDQIVYFCQAGRPVKGLTPSAPLDLSVMNASSTVRLAFDHLFVPDDAVVRIVAGDRWREQDRVNTSRVNPAVFGIAAACRRRIRVAAAGSQGLIEELEETLDAEERACRAAARAPNAPLEALREAKAWSLSYALNCAHALVAATGGRAMSIDHPAQRLLREAAFYSIQAQTREMRESTLSALLNQSRARTSSAMIQ